MMMLEFAVYFWCVAGKPDFLEYGKIDAKLFVEVFLRNCGEKWPLVFMGGFTVCKVLIEIWGQETSNWVCPGTLFMFFVIVF